MLDQHGPIALRGGLHHLFEAHPHEPHPIFERTAVLVAAVVGIGRQKLRNQIAVTGVHLDRIESGIGSRMHSAAEILGDLHDFALTHPAHGRIGVEVESGRRTNGNLSGGGKMSHVAAMPDLEPDSGPLAVDGIGQVAQGGDDFGPQPQLFAERKAAPAHGGIGDGRHADAPAGDRDVVVLELLRRAEVLPHRLESGRPDDAVAQHHGAQLIRREKFGHINR